jgi:hypothetical protein
MVAVCHGIGALMPHVAQGCLKLGDQGICMGVLRHCGGRCPGGAQHSPPKFSTTPCGPRSRSQLAAPHTAFAAVRVT